ncbi:hypothetical protein [Nonomuraea recticatena]|uniref:hypothetical protein n=1 Tax=Nonomuraea recticatena TaxID=46178 RepID=UPI00361E1454
MNRILLGKRGWMILAAVLAMGLIGSAGLAIANPYGNVSNEETCAVWDPLEPRDTSSASIT